MRSGADADLRKGVGQVRFDGALRGFGSGMSLKGGTTRERAKRRARWRRLLLGATRLLCRV
ncbi:MAG: hypothetical protein ACYDG8_03210 [Vulcanimicrobiaceae bacterium]